MTTIEQHRQNGLELTTTMPDLTAFQRDTLRCIAMLNKRNDEPPHGLALRDWLETDGGYFTVHHGRLYPNLDRLAEKGLIEKGQKDDRTNEYTLTDRGRREIRQRATDWLRVVEVVVPREPIRNWIEDNKLVFDQPGELTDTGPEHLADMIASEIEKHSRDMVPEQ